MITASLNQANGSVGNAAVGMPPAPEKRTRGIGVTANFVSQVSERLGTTAINRRKTAALSLSAHGLEKGDSENIILFKDFLRTWLVDDVSVTVSRCRMHGRTFAYC
jgi:hypothetical protein